MTPSINWRITWPTNYKSFFYVNCVSGLGNRIKALVSAIRINKKLSGRQLAIGWGMDDYHCHCPFNYLFTNPITVLSPNFFSSTGYIDYHTIKVKSPTVIETNNNADVIWVNEENFFYTAGERDVMFGQHSPDKMTNPFLRDELFEAFDELRLHPYIEQSISRFSNDNFLNNTVVGLHIRRGDNIWANQYIPNDLFHGVVLSVLSAYNKDVKIFLCTDDPETEIEFQRKYGDKILLFNKSVPAYSRNNSPIAVQEALIEMILLSKTSTIIRSSSSTFSQCASWFGRVPTIEVGQLEHSW